MAEASQPGAFHVFQDTLATAVVTGSVNLTAALAQLDPTSLLPLDWVFAMELRLFCDDPWVFSSSINAINEVPGPRSLWIPISTVNAHKKLWFRGISGGETLNWMIEGKVRGSTP